MEFHLYDKDIIIAVYFSGVSASDSVTGRAGAGASVFNLASAKSQRVGEFLFEEFLPLSSKLTTTTIAEYMGVIAGLRKLIRFLQGIPPKDVRVILVGDSETILNHLEASVEEISDPGQKRLATILDGLKQSFRDVAFSQVSKEENQLAHKAAERASLNEVKANSLRSIRFQPNLMCAAKCISVRLSPVESTSTADHLNPGEIYCSSDLLSAFADDKNKIDASYLSKLENGTEALQEIKDPSPFSVCIGMCDMNVIGILDRPLFLSVSIDGQHEYVPVQVDNVFVVESLPTPLQLCSESLSLPDLTFQMNSASQKLTRGAFPSEYKSHPYWDMLEKSLKGPPEVAQS